MFSLENLPLDLGYNVLSRLPLHDLRTLRLISRALSNIVTAYLFSTLHLCGSTDGSSLRCKSAEYAELADAVEQLSSIAPVVKKLIFAPVFYHADEEPICLIYSPSITKRS